MRQELPLPQVVLQIPEAAALLEPPLQVEVLPQLELQLEPPGYRC